MDTSHVSFNTSGDKFEQEHLNQINQIINNLTPNTSINIAASNPLIGQTNGLTHTENVDTNASDKKMYTINANTNETVKSISAQGASLNLNMTKSKIILKAPVDSMNNVHQTAQIRAINLFPQSAAASQTNLNQPKQVFLTNNKTLIQSIPNMTQSSQQPHSIIVLAPANRSLNSDQNIQFILQQKPSTVNLSTTNNILNSNLQQKIFLPTTAPINLIKNININNAKVKMSAPVATQLSTNDTSKNAAVVTTPSSAQSLSIQQSAQVKVEDQNQNIKQVFRNDCTKSVNDLSQNSANFKAPKSELISNLINVGDRSNFEKAIQIEKDLPEGLVSYQMPNPPEMTNQALKTALSSGPLNLMKPTNNNGDKVSVAQNVKVNTSTKLQPILTPIASSSAHNGAYKTQNQQVKIETGHSDALLPPQMNLNETELRNCDVDQTTTELELLLNADSLLNDLILPDTRIFASLLNKDNNNATAANVSNDKKIDTNLMCKKAVIGNREHIIIDNSNNLSDYKGNFSDLKKLATIMADQFNRPVTIPAFLVVEQQSTVDSVKQMLDQKNIKPVVIDTISLTEMSTISSQNFQYPPPQSQAQPQPQPQIVNQPVQKPSIEIEKPIVTTNTSQVDANKDVQTTAAKPRKKATKTNRSKTVAGKLNSEHPTPKMTIKNITLMSNLNREKLLNSNSQSSLPEQVKPNSVESSCQAKKKPRLDEHLDPVKLQTNESNVVQAAPLVAFIPNETKMDVNQQHQTVLMAEPIPVNMVDTSQHDSYQYMNHILNTNDSKQEYVDAIKMESNDSFFDSKNPLKKNFLNECDLNFDHFDVNLLFNDIEFTN